MNGSGSYLVTLIGADGHPRAVRNTEVLEVAPWDVWMTNRAKRWVFDDVVVVVLPAKEPLKFSRPDGHGGEEVKNCWCFIPVKGPLEEVVTCLNQGIHMHRS